MLVVGTLDEFIDDESPTNLRMFESFERFRRSLTDPEIITFDELFARARMVVTLADYARASGAAPDVEDGEWLVSRSDLAAALNPADRSTPTSLKLDRMCIRPLSR